MNNIEVHELNELITKIRLNKATTEDYVRYENILTSNGYTKQQVNQKLTSIGIYGYNDLLKERELAEKDLARRQTIQTIAIAGLIGLGLAVLISSISEKNK